MRMNGPASRLSTNTPIAASRAAKGGTAVIRKISSSRNTRKAKAKATLRMRQEAKSDCMKGTSVVSPGRKRVTATRWKNLR